MKSQNKGQDAICIPPSLIKYENSRICNTSGVGTPCDKRSDLVLCIHKLRDQIVYTATEVDRLMLGGSSRISHGVPLTVSEV